MLSKVDSNSRNWIMKNTEDRGWIKCSQIKKKM